MLEVTWNQPGVGMPWLIAFLRGVEGPGLGEAPTVSRRVAQENLDGRWRCQQGAH